MQLPGQLPAGLPITWRKWGDCVAKVTVIFLTGDALIDEVIDVFSHGKFSHVALKINNRIIEALGMKKPKDQYPGVWFRDPDEYDDDPNATRIDVDLPNIDAAEQEAEKLKGTHYGYTDCVFGGIYDNTGLKIPGNELTANCSETVTRILRAGGFNILPNVPADDITPNDLAKGLGLNV